MFPSSISMGAFIDFSELPPDATWDDIERMRGGGEERSRSASISEEQRRSDSVSCGTNAQSISAQQQVATFPAKLHDILSDPSHNHIIRWLPHGRSWEVSSYKRFLLSLFCACLAYLCLPSLRHWFLRHHMYQVVDQKKFMEEVAPTYFAFSKWASFTRQITGWNFVRNPGGPDRGSYYHELFMRGRPHLVKFMKREVIGQAKEKKKKKPPKICEAPNNDGSLWHEPNFYELSRAHPLPDSLGCDGADIAAASSGSDVSQEVALASSGTHQHQHYMHSGYSSPYHSNADTVIYPPSAYPYHQNGHPQWATSTTDYNSYYGNYAPTAQGFTAPPPHAGPWGYTATDTAAYYGDHYQHQHQGQQQYANDNQTHAFGSNADMYGGMHHHGSVNDHTYPPSAGSGDNAQVPDGTSNQNGSTCNETQSHPEFLPPMGIRGDDDAASSSHQRLPSLDEEQRTALLGLLSSRLPLVPTAAMETTETTNDQR